MIKVNKVFPASDISSYSEFEDAFIESMMFEWNN